jgi:hypothetical protein
LTASPTDNTPTDTGCLTATVELSRQETQHNTTTAIKSSPDKFLISLYDVIKSQQILTHKSSKINPIIQKNGIKTTSFTFFEKFSPKNLEVSKKCVPLHPH